MFSVEEIKSFVIEHKKAIIAVVAIVALLIILYQFRERCYYLSTFYGWFIPQSKVEDYYYEPIVPETSVFNGGEEDFEILPEISL